MLRMFCLASFLALSITACSSSSNACGKLGNDCDPFPTFQACYDEHHTKESFPTDKAIEICCIDHPIGNQKMNVVCGDTTQSCETYVTANLTDASDPNLAADITTACTNYPGDSGR